MFTGVSTRPSVNPKPIKLRPWNNFIIQRNVTVANSSSFSITATYIHDVFLEQLGITTDSPLEFRLKKIEAHDLAGRPITLQAVDYTTATDTVNESLQTSYGFPGRDTWARVGVTWPSAISSSPILVSGSTANNTIVAFGTVGSPFGVVNSASTSVLLKITLLWKPNSTTSAVNAKPLVAIHSDIPFSSEDKPSHTSKSLNVSHKFHNMHIDL